MLTTENISSLIFEPLGPIYKHVYKIKFSEKRINQLIAQKLAKKNGKLKSLKVRFFDKWVFLKGYAHINKKYINKRINVNKIGFGFILQTNAVAGAKIVFSIKKFILMQQDKFNWLPWYNRFSNTPRRKILQEFHNSQAPIESVDNYQKLAFDLNYFLKDIPEVIGQFAIEAVYHEKDKLVVLCKSNLLLITALDMLSTNLIQIEAMSNEDLDIFSTIWNVLRSSL